jgi:hypothetical protein
MEVFMSFDTMTKILDAAVANGGTFTVGYLDGRGPGSYTLGTGHHVVSPQTGKLTIAAGQVAFSFGASLITITNNTGQSIPAGSTLIIQVERFGASEVGRVARFACPGSMGVLTPTIISLGAPIASDADGIVASQNCTVANGLATGINGALASGGVCVLDVPRAIVAAWTNTAVLTVTGTDEYGRRIRQSSASGTTMTGTKAFKTITGVSTSADITGLTVGTGKVLGLPVFLPGTGLVIRELQDGAAATAGTIVAGVTSVATATTGDVRGTYAPNGNPNGALSFQLIAMLENVDDRGVAQF